VKVPDSSLESKEPFADAAGVGLSRPQVTNGLNGVFGFGPEAAAKLKAFLEVA